MVPHALIGLLAAEIPVVGEVLAELLALLHRTACLFAKIELGKRHAHRRLDVSLSSVLVERRKNVVIGRDNSGISAAHAVGMNEAAHLHSPCGDDGPVLTDKVNLRVQVGLAAAVELLERHGRSTQFKQNLWRALPIEIGRGTVGVRPLRRRNRKRLISAGDVTGHACRCAHCRGGTHKAPTRHVIHFEILSLPLRSDVSQASLHLRLPFDANQAIHVLPPTHWKLAPPTWGVDGKKADK